MASQPHTEDTVRHTDGQQDTGNHKVPNAPDAGGADRFGGSRAGAENVEHGVAGDAQPERPGRAPSGAGDAERVVETEDEGHLQER